MQINYVNVNVIMQMVSYKYYYALWYINHSQMYLSKICLNTFVCIYIFILNKFQYYTNILRIPLHILFDLCLLDLEIKARVYACVCVWMERALLDGSNRETCRIASICVFYHAHFDFPRATASHMYLEQMSLCIPTPVSKCESRSSASIDRDEAELSASRLCINDVIALTCV